MPYIIDGIGATHYFSNVKTPIMHICTTPECETCGKRFKPNDAIYDARLSGGSWAAICQSCFDAFGCSLGVGKGQKYKWGNPIQDR